MDFAILVGSCDKYSFLWEDFLFFFNKYWDHSIDVKKYILTTDLDANLPGFETIKTKTQNFGSGLKKAINYMKADSILWLQDDYFFRNTIDEKKFSQYYDFFITNQCDRLGFHPDSTLYQHYRITSDIFRFRQFSHYTLSLQASLWCSHFMYHCVGTNDFNPWEFEIHGSSIVNKNVHHRIFFTPQLWYLEACKQGNYTEDYYNMIKEKE